MQLNLRKNSNASGVWSNYDPTDNKAIAFVLTIHSALECGVYQIIVLGLHHNGAIRLSVRVQAQQNGDEW